MHRFNAHFKFMTRCIYENETKFTRNYFEFHLLVRIELDYYTFIMDIYELNNNYKSDSSF